MKKLRIILFILTGLSIIPWTTILDIETRTEFTNSLIDQNGLFFFLILLILLTYLITNTLYGKTNVLLKAIFQFIGLFILGTITVLCFGLPNMWADKIVYRQSNDQYLIIQHFAFGVTGSRPEWRIIKTRNLKAPIRSVKYIDQSNFAFLKMDTWGYSADTIPQTLRFKNDTYTLLYKE